MERTREYPWGRCETCGQPGSARNDLTLYSWAGARECRGCMLTTLAHKMKAEDSLATLEDCLFTLNEWTNGRNLADVAEYRCADHIRAFLEAAS